MVVFRCKECGKEYELDTGDNPKDFQCDCGGALLEESLSNFKESHNITQVKITPLGKVLGILSIFLIGLVFLFLIILLIFTVLINLGIY